MKVAILAVGSELVRGRVLNTTSSLAARELARHGYETEEIITVPDRLPLIKEHLRRCLDRYPVVIVSGGLGPTTDDRTSEAVAEALEVPLETREDVLRRIEEWERREGLSPNPLRRRMAELPRGAVLLSRRKPVAGYYLRPGGKLLFCLPGVPEEFASLLREEVVQVLRELAPSGETVRSETYRLFGLREADLNLGLRELEALSGVEIGYYPVLPELHLSVLVRGRDPRRVEDTFRRVTERVEDLFGEHIFARGDEPLEAVVGRLLGGRGATLAVAESCTGGLIASRLVRVPGSSAYFERGVVAYTNEAKREMLGVPAEALERHGAVSRPVALAMAEGVRRLGDTDYALAVTGIAGPTGGSPQKPVGTVWIALADRRAARAMCFRFPGDRNLVQDFAATTALDWLRRYLAHGTPVPGYRFAFPGES